MIIEDIIESSTLYDSKICIFDRSSGQYLFDGTVEKVPEDLYYYVVDTWEAYNNKLRINIFK